MIYLVTHTATKKNLCPDLDNVSEMCCLVEFFC